MTERFDARHVPAKRGIAPGPTLELVAPRSSRFAQQPFRLRDFGAWEGRALPPNANAKRQAAARKARKATRRAG